MTLEKKNTFTSSSDSSARAFPHYINLLLEKMATDVHVYIMYEYKNKYTLVCVYIYKECKS